MQEPVRPATQKNMTTCKIHVKSSAQDRWILGWMWTKSTNHVMCPRLCIKTGFHQSQLSFIDLNFINFHERFSWISLMFIDFSLLFINFHWCSSTFLVPPATTHTTPQGGNHGTIPWTGGWRGKPGSHACILKIENWAWSIVCANENLWFRVQSFLDHQVLSLWP